MLIIPVAAIGAGAFILITCGFCCWYKRRSNDSRRKTIDKQTPKCQHKPLKPIIATTEEEYTDEDDEMVFVIFDESC